MVRREIDIDEHWPVFSLVEPRRQGPFVVDLDEEFYKEYCYFMYKYHEYQLRIQVIYEQQQASFNQQNVGRCFPKDSIVDTKPEFNRIRKLDVAEATV